MRIGINKFQKMKNNGELIPMVTAYDYTSAVLSEQADIPLILVGDSLGMVVMGLDSTIPVTLENMIHHTQMVVRATEKSHIVSDLPFMSYQISPEQAIENAGRLIKESGCQSVKLEGGSAVKSSIKKIVDAGIPVMGHIGLKPQSILIESGYKIHGKTTESALNIYKDAIALEEAGVFAVVLEGVPIELAELITNKLKIPTIGIGAGHLCNGQIQVLHDIIGLLGEKVPKHAFPYIHNKQIIKNALIKYQNDVINNEFSKLVQAKKMDTIEFTKLKEAIENI